MNIITANRLLDGVVVYRTRQSGWTERFEDAARYEASESPAALAAAEQDVLQVVKPYLVALDGPDVFTKRERMREGIRAAGPTVRRDLGKQAGSEQAGSEGA